MTTRIPHRFPRDKQIAPNSADIMRHILYALTLGVALQAVFFGIGVLIQLALGAITALICEYGVGSLRRRQVTTLDLSSGCVTAALLALSIPATAPWTLVVCGVAVGILLGKHVYGGIGMNIFNPAMVGFCTIYLSFAAQISLYPTALIGISDTLALIFDHATLDGITGATALASMKANAISLPVPTSAIVLNVAWLLGGVYLCWRNMADWRLIVTFIGAFSAFSLAILPFSHFASTFGQQLGLGAVIFTACFIITDPTTAATSRKGRIIYALLAAFLAVIIRQFSQMPDSMAFSILLANACAPLIDTYTRPQYK